MFFYKVTQKALNFNKLKKWKIPKFQLYILNIIIAWLIFINPKAIINFKNKNHR